MTATLSNDTANNQVKQAWYADNSSMQSDHWQA